MQAVVAALGFTANLGPIRDWGVDIIGNRYIPADTTMATNLPGVFAAGDITDYRGKVRLIAVGFGQAATAVNNVAVVMNTDEQLFSGPGRGRSRLRGADVSEVFQDAGGVFRTRDRQAGIWLGAGSPELGSFASFSDPGGNSWFVQKITSRLPGRCPAV